MRINLSVKKLFFDRRRVMSAGDRATRRVLSRFGAFVRTRSRSSIRRRKRISRPGRPPSSHTGLLKLIYFAFEPRERRVIIGPAKLNGVRAVNAPQVLEEGGRVRNRKGRNVHIRERPFMGPAFAIERESTLPALWKNSVR